MISPLERLWKDKMNIYRWEENKVNGITKSSEVLKYTDVKCQFSKANLTDTGTNGTPTINNSFTLFCSVETDLKEGDKIIVTQRNGRQITLAVGEEFPYTNHKEFSVKRSDTA